MSVCSFCKSSFIPHKKHPNAKRCSDKRCAQAYKNEWARHNPDCKRRWVLRNPEKRAQASKAYVSRHKGYYTEYSSLRTRRVEQSKPKWLDEFQLFWIEELYDLAQRRKLEVDHVIPIKHSKVCGLHVPWNMQLLSRSANARKSNKFNEDVVAVIIGADKDV